MEIRHIIGIIAAVGYVAFTQRERLKTLASAAFARLKPIAGSGKAGWLVAAVIGGVTFWPDVSGYLPDFGKADQIEALEQTIVNQDNQIRDLSERNQWQAEQIEELMAETPDIFNRAAASGRALLADSITEFAGTKYDSDQAAEDAMNERILDCLEAAFGPVGKEIEKARAASRLTDMAAKLKAGELRDE